MTFSVVWHSHTVVCLPYTATGNGMPRSFCKTNIMNVHNLDNLHEKPFCLTSKHTNNLSWVDLLKHFDGYFGVSVSITGFVIHTMVIQGPEVLKYNAGCKYKLLVFMTQRFCVQLHYSKESFLNYLGMMTKAVAKTIIL